MNHGFDRGKVGLMQFWCRSCRKGWAELGIEVGTSALLALTCSSKLSSSFDHPVLGHEDDVLNY